MPAATHKIHDNDTWLNMSLMLLSIRFVQGFIFWGGGSRRFIYAPQKLDPDAASWMANKLQSAMPGALLDLHLPISFLLQHFILLYTAIILFSLAEILTGIALLTGTMSRLAGFISIALSVSLMLIFGWQGGTCMDEWTMAVCNLAMGCTLAIAGSGLYSVDHYLMRRYPRLAKRKWFLWCASGELSTKWIKKLSLAFLTFTVVFSLATYNYYRGSIITPYHNGPVSPRNFHVSFSHANLMPTGYIIFTAYIDAGTPAIPSHIVNINLTTADDRVLYTWAGDKMTAKNVSIHNIYAYNKFIIGPYGLIAATGAKAVISLTPEHQLHLGAGKYYLNLFSVDGQIWKTELKI